ncbi:hypothetical protein IRJ41_002145 [Triplophysa rosa]|uniref:Uncharacterized protein n=1 Tax=Triplophysa rosa TaxID=992332 RepID=A0A9W7T6H0_TRIRA|nr:hypothetical protein IRJ41_002145 [Triplophysa rosa]
MAGERVEKGCSACSARLAAMATSQVPRRQEPTPYMQLIEKLAEEEQALYPPYVIEFEESSESEVSVKAKTSEELKEQYLKNCMIEAERPRFIVIIPHCRRRVQKLSRCTQTIPPVVEKPLSNRERRAKAVKSFFRKKWKAVKRIFGN